MANAHTGDPINFTIHLIRDSKRLHPTTRLHVLRISKDISDLAGSDPRTRAIAADAINSYTEWAHGVHLTQTGNPKAPTTNTMRALSENFRKCMRMLGPSNNRRRHVRTSPFTAPREGEPDELDGGKSAPGAA